MIQEKSCGCIIIKDNKVLLIKHKKGHWDFPKGHMEKDETEIETAIREVKEETNLDVVAQEQKRYTVEYITDIGNIKQVVYFLVDKSEGKIKPQESEVSKIEWVDFAEAENIITYDTSKQLWRKILKELEGNLVNSNKKCKSYDFLGKSIKVKIDRKMGSKHPKYSFIYLCNYGFVPNTISGDGEELDCYVLGVFEPIDEFEGKCIAIIHRLNEDDDKLIVVPKNKNFSNKEIEVLIEFQERFFEHEIIRKDIYDMKKLNLIVVFDKNLDKVLFCIRAKEPYKGLYNLVGGKVEEKESNDEAAYRELFEETGISRDDIKLEHFMDLNYFKYNNNLQVYYGILNHKVKLVEEKNKLQWVIINEELLNTKKFAGNYNIPHIIKQIKVYLNNGI